MNQLHLQYLASPEWAARLESDLLPWIERVATLGDDVLEIGPGPGMTTDILRHRAPRVTAIELDAALAGSLAARLSGSNVDVHVGDARALPFVSNRFSSATCFSVMHHVPSAEHQDRVLAELLRVLRPGAGFFATDARDTPLLRGVHDDDTFVPMPTDTLVERLERIGFVDIDLELTEYELRVSAVKPD